MYKLNNKLWKFLFIIIIFLLSLFHKTSLFIQVHLQIYILENVYKKYYKIKLM